MTPAQASLLDDAREIWPIGKEHLSEFECALVWTLSMRRDEFGLHAVMTHYEEAVLADAYAAMCEGIKTGFDCPSFAAIAAIIAAPAVSWSTPEAAA